MDLLLSVFLLFIFLVIAIIHIALFYCRRKIHYIYFQTRFLDYWQPYFFYFGLTYFFISSIEYSFSSIFSILTQCDKGTYTQYSLADDYTWNFLFEQIIDCIPCLSQSSGLCGRICNGSHIYEMTPLIPTYIFSFVVILFGYGYVLYHFLSEISDEVKFSCNEYQLYESSHEVKKAERVDNHSHYLHFLKSPDYKFVNDFTFHNFYWRFYQLFEELFILLADVFSDNISQNFVFLVPIFFLLSAIFIFIRKPYMCNKNRNYDIFFEVLQCIVAIPPVFNLLAIEPSSVVLWIISISIILTTIPGFLFEFVMSKISGDEEKKKETKFYSNEEFQTIFDQIASLVPDERKPSAFVKVNDIKIDRHFKRYEDIPKQIRELEGMTKKLKEKIENSDPREPDDKLCFPYIEIFTKKQQKLYNNICLENPKTILYSNQSEYGESKLYTKDLNIEDLDIDRFDEYQYSMVTSLIYDTTSFSIYHSNKFILKVFQLFWIIAIPVGWYCGSIVQVFSAEINLQC